ncbi:MAG: glycosyltransferase [Polyangiaceae bacterium]
MRALFFGESPHRIGGAQKSLLAALRHVRRFGLDPIVAFPAGGVYADAVRQAGLDVRILEAPAAINTYGKALLRLAPEQLVSTTLREILPFSYQLARLADRERCEVMHFNNQRGLILGGLAAAQRGSAAVLHVRGYPSLGRPIWIACHALADELICVTERLRSYVAPSRQDHCHVVYNGVDFPESVDRVAARAWLAELLAEHGVRLEPGELVFVSLNTPVPFKGLHHLVEAAGRLTARGIKARYVLAGTGLPGDTYQAWLERRAATLGVGDRIHFVGYVERAIDLVAAADLTLLTSVVRETFEYDGKVVELAGEEGLPRSILESMAVGTPVVATDGGGVREQLVEGDTGFIVPPSDAMALADAIERAARDDVFRAPRRSAARRCARNSRSTPRPRGWFGCSSTPRASDGPLRSARAIWSTSSRTHARIR